DLNGAFRKAGVLGNRAQAGADRFPVLFFRFPVKIKENKERGRLMIMPDQVRHQDVNDVIVDRDGATKAWHDQKIAPIPINGQHFSRLTTTGHWTPPRAAT